MEIKRCEKNPPFDQCAEEEDINKWLESKTAQIRYNSKSVNFQDSDKYVGLTT